MLFLNSLLLPNNTHPPYNSLHSVLEEFEKLSLINIPKTLVKCEA